MWRGDAGMVEHRVVVAVERAAVVGGLDLERQWTAWPMNILADSDDSKLMADRGAWRNDHPGGNPRGFCGPRRKRIQGPQRPHNR